MLPCRLYDCVDSRGFHCEFIGIVMPRDHPSGQKLTDSMSDPGTTYRTRDEVQEMRAKQDTIQGLKKNILEWGVADEASLKVCLGSIWP